MKLIYILNFDINGKEGRNKVSKEKAAALKDILGVENFKLWYPKQVGKSKIEKYLGYIFFDLICAYKLLIIDQPKNTTVLYRVLLFPLSHLVMYLRGIKCVYEVHADFPNEIKHLQKSTVEQFLLQIIAQFDALNLKTSNGIIYNHPYLLKTLNKRYPKPCIYTYNAVNTNNVKPMPKNTVRAELNIKEHERIALFLGSVSKWHGVHYLVKAFNQEVLKNSINYKLYIVGCSETPYVTELKELAKGNTNIHFINRVSFDVAQLYINAADICLLPVDNIRTSPGSPIKLYEYAACGKPILAQAGLEGYSDETINNQLGKVTDFTNTISAAIDIKQFLNDNNTDFYYRNNIQKSQNELSWQVRMTTWMNFIKSLK